MAVIFNRPITEQVTAALANLRAARLDGDWAKLQTAQHRFDWLCDQLPRRLERETHP